MSRVPVFRVTARRCRRCSARPRLRVARRRLARSPDPDASTPPLFPEPHTPGSQRVSGRCTCQSAQPRRDVLRRSRVAPDHDRFARLPHHQRSRRCDASDRRCRFRRYAGSGVASRSPAPLRSSITNSQPIVGYVSAGLSASASGSTSLNQCSTQTKTSVNTLTFTENFGTAFKTRVAAQSNNLYAGQIGNLRYPITRQPVRPGAIYNSESNFVFPVPRRTPAAPLVWRISAPV